MLRTLLTGLALTSLAFVPRPGPPAPPQDMSGVTIESEKLTIGTWMLTGAGGNMGLLVGDSGALLIDDQFGGLSDKILEAIASKTDQPLRWVLNTHWHGDHTGGNANLADAGALIVAHENVRERLSVDQYMEAFQRTTPASPAKAWPTITFAEGLDLHWNGQDIRLIHVPNAHTDGDAMVFIEGANVLHMGDLFFNGMYPFIDTSSDGSIDGVIAGVDRALELVDNQTAIIPGHGLLANRSALLAYRDMLFQARKAIVALMDDGMNREQVIAAHPTQELDEDWGGGFMQPDTWTGIVYDSLR
jgi:glyoxylase-like metal-dependent hydrolase (beta-lactamase superfamily II)